MAYEARLEIGVDSRGAKRDVDGLDDSLGKVERSGDRADKATRRFGRGARSTAVELNRLRHIAIGFVGAIGGAAAVRTIVRASDTYTNLRSQLRLVTDSQEELNRVYEQTFELAQDTRQDFESTAQLYTKLARSTDELNLSNEELLKITRAINQSFIVSGAGAEEAAGAVRQLSQGMASGTLRGDELNSVMENSPRLARAIADQLGVTIGQLRQLGADGEITAEKISAALIGASDDIDREFQSMQRTVGQSLQQLRNDLTNTFGRTDTSQFVSAIDDLREIVTDPSFQRSVVDLGTAFATLVGWMGRAANQSLNIVRNFNQAVNAHRGLLTISDQVSESISAIESAMHSMAVRDGELQVTMKLATGEIIEQGTSVEQLKRRLIELRAIQERYANSPIQLPPVNVDSGDSGGGPPSTPRGPSSKALKEQEDELDRLIEASVRYTKEISAARKADAEAQQARQDALQSVRESLMTEEEAILSSYERRREIVLRNTEEGSLERRALLSRLEQQTNTQLEDINRGFWERYLEAAQMALTTLDDLALSTVDRFSSGVGDAFESMIFDAKSAGEAFRQLGETMLRSVVNALGKMAAEWIAYQLVQMLVEKQTAASSASTMLFQAQAMSKMAALNAYASTAAIPIYGPAAAPGAASVATAVTEPLAASVGALAFAGAFDRGGRIPAGKWGIAGERGPEIIQGPAQVTSRRDTAEMMKGEGVTVNVQNAPPGTQVRERRVDGRQIVDIMVADINGGGSLSRAISGAYGLKRRGR